MNSKYSSILCHYVHTTLIPFSCIPGTAYYPHYKTFLYAQWHSFFLINKLHTEKLSISSQSAPFHQNRHWETALARLLIGHTHLMHSYLMLQIMFLFQSHTLLSCPHFTAAHTFAFDQLSSLQWPPNLHRNNTLCFINLFSFLRCIHIQINCWHPSSSYSCYPTDGTNKEGYTPFVSAHYNPLLWIIKSSKQNQVHVLTLCGKTEGWMMGDFGRSIIMVVEHSNIPVWHKTAKGDWF